MKAIIDGLRYDTSKAEMIGKQANNYQQVEEDKSHPMYWTAALYATVSGRFFLAGSGNVESELALYAIDLYNDEYPLKNKIIPITEAQAFTWCCKNQQLDVTEAWFEHLIEDA